MTSSPTPRTACSLGSAAAALLVLGAAPAAEARGGGDRVEVRRSGSCSAGAHWTLKSKQDDGALETELEVDSDRAGQRWSVVLRDNGHQVLLIDKSPAAIRRGLYTMKAIDTMAFEESMAFTESQIALFTLTEDAKEGQAAFQQKRKPEFHGVAGASMTR